MILVDSSVWIANLRGLQTGPVRKLHAIDNAVDTILVGDLILMEVLMGARDEASAARIERDLRCFDFVRLADPETAVQAARHYRVLRGLGCTIRTGIDMLIGSWCVRHGHSLLHDDRDFAPMQQHLGLAVL